MSESLYRFGAICGLVLAIPVGAFVAFAIACLVKHKLRVNA